MKRIIIHATAALVALWMATSLFVACGKSEKEESTTSADTSVTSVEDTAQTEVPESGIRIHSGNLEKVKVVRSDDIPTDSVWVKMSVAFYQKLNRLFEGKAQIGTDFVMPNKKPLEGQIDIILGETTVAESKAFHEKILAIGTPAYGISVSGNKISVTGTSIYLVYCGLDHLLETFVTEDANGKPQMVLEDGFEFIEQVEADYPTTEEILKSGKKPAFYAVEKLAKTPSQGNYKGMQGGGTDGKYAYYASIDGSTTPETAIIHKYDMSTWELVATSDPMPSAHTNDITYDSKNHRLVISYCSATDGYLGIVFVNPDTLEYLGYVKAPTASRGVDYFPDTDQYLFAVNYTYYLTNDKFETIKSIPDGYPRLTSQGFDSDGKYIYDPRWEPGAEYQTISVNTMSGSFVGAIPLYGIEGEPENLFCDGNTFVMGCNGSNTVFRLALMFRDWWD